MNCKHNRYTLDCAWCGYHKDPYRAFVDAVDRIQELESAIRDHKEDMVELIKAKVFGKPHLDLWAVLDKTEDKE